MNRRHLFKFAALGAAGLLLPEPMKTYFLPPAGGWRQPSLRMREIEQYLINDDTFAMRWDARFMDGTQAYVLSMPLSGLELIPMSESERELHVVTQREAARSNLQVMAGKHGGVSDTLPPLPNSAHLARYV